MESELYKVSDHIWVHLRLDPVDGFSFNERSELSGLPVALAELRRARNSRNAIASSWPLLAAGKFRRDLSV